MDSPSLGAGPRWTVEEDHPLWRGYDASDTDDHKVGGRKRQRHDQRG